MALVPEVVEDERPRIVLRGPTQPSHVPDKQLIGVVEEHPAIARDWAHMLLELFKASNPNRNITFDIVVTDAKALTGWYYYEWGNECTALVDKACPNCGMIQTIPANIELDCDCSVGSGATQLGLYRTYRTFVDDTIYTTIITR